MSEALTEVEIEERLAALPPAKRQALELILLRRRARRSFRDWCLLSLAPIVPAAHHEYIISKCQEVADSPIARKVIFLMPPGSAKSTYISGNLPAWYLGRRPGSTVLACSYASDFADRWGRRCRNFVNQFHNELGFNLAKDSQAAGEWETTNNGRYFCAGVGGGIAGHRADLAIIDDYLGSKEDADSATVREKQWGWLVEDFWPRLKPNASFVIIANRRHEDDLVGRLLGENKDITPPWEPSSWEVVKFPYFAEDDDVLGRVKADPENQQAVLDSRLWPEWYTEEHARGVLKQPPRTKAGLWQQRPAPEDGDFFKKDNLIGYDRDQLMEIEARGGLKYYGSGDFACSEEKDANRVCLLSAGVDSYHRIWILPDIFWRKASTDKTIDAFCAWAKRRNPMAFVGEKGQISKSIGPFMKKQQRAERAWCPIIEVTPSHAKDVRAKTAQGLTECQEIMFPHFANWWPEAYQELLKFPGGSTDDLVDALAHLCNYINSMLVGQTKKEDKPQPGYNSEHKFRPNGEWLNKLKREQSALGQSRYNGR